MPETRKARDGGMYTEQEFLDYYGPMGQQLWNLAKPEISAEESGPRTALAAQEPSSGPEVTLSLELPDGEVEEVTVATSKDGVAVLMKVMALRKKHECLLTLSEEVELVTQDGFILQVD